MHLRFVFQRIVIHWGCIWLWRVELLSPRGYRIKHVSRSTLLLLIAEFENLWLPVVRRWLHSWRRELMEIHVGKGQWCLGQAWSFIYHFGAATSQLTWPYLRSAPVHCYLRFLVVVGSLSYWVFAIWGFVAVGYSLFLIILSEIYISTFNSLELIISCLLKWIHIWLVVQRVFIGATCWIRMWYRIQKHWPAIERHKRLDLAVKVIVLVIWCSIFVLMNSYCTRSLWIWFLVLLRQAHSMLLAYFIRKLGLIQQILSILFSYLIQWRLGSFWRKLIAFLGESLHLRFSIYETTGNLIRTVDMYVLW